MNNREWRNRARRWKRIMLSQAEQIDALYAQKNGEINALREQLVALQESDFLDLLAKKRLLAWQRRVREAWRSAPGPSVAAANIAFLASWNDLRDAIEGESVEPGRGGAEGVCQAGSATTYPA